jgi:DNA repair protein RecO (recombination protein O)
MSVTLRDEGVVLKNHKLGEADKIITIMTRNNGKISAVAKGVRKTKSNKGIPLSPLQRVDIKFTLGRSLDIINEVEIIDAFATTLAKDYDKFVAGAQMAELLDKIVTLDHEPFEQQYLLIVRALRALATAATSSPNIITLSYIVRALAVAGWEIDPGNLPSSGVAVPRGLTLEKAEEIFESLLQGDFANLNLPADVELAVTKAIARYASEHLETGFRSF